MKPSEVDTLITSDEKREYRNLRIVDTNGDAQAFTDSKCIPEAGHIIGRGYSVQANLASSRDVITAMARAFEEAEGGLAERLMKTLEAGEAAGGDVRGGSQPPCLWLG